MPALKNARHERFAQELAKGETADAAYVAAGFKANRGNAATLKANQSVKDRVEELQGRAAEKAEWTAADRLIMLQAIAINSLAVEPRVSVAAIAEANKMQGSHAPVKQDVEFGGALTVQYVTAKAGPPPKTSDEDYETPA